MTNICSTVIQLLLMVSALEDAASILRYINVLFYLFYSSNKPCAISGRPPVV